MLCIPKSKSQFILIVQRKCSMNIFITGGTGFIGSAVTQELIQAGHKVVGLSRSIDSDKKLTDLGATPIRGELKDLDIITKEAKQADGVIHLAFVHNFADFENSVKLDAQVIQTIGQALVNTNKAFVVTKAVFQSHTVVSQPKILLGMSLNSHD